MFIQKLNTYEHHAITIEQTITIDFKITVDKKYALLEYKTNQYSPSVRILSINITAKLN